MPSINFNFLQQLARNPRFVGNAAANFTEIRAGREERNADPTMLQIEVTSRCNFRCSYCIVHNGTESETPGDMSLDMFRHVLDRFPRSYYLQLHGQGEPLLHPHLEEMITFAEQQSRFSSIVSNGSLWTEFKSKGLLAAGVDVIAISLDLDSPEKMEADRIGLTYQDVVKSVGQLIRWRDTIRPLTAVGISAVVKETPSRSSECTADQRETTRRFGNRFLICRATCRNEHISWSVSGTTSLRAHSGSRPAQAHTFSYPLHGL